jgi:hypothetical protein
MAAKKGPSFAMSAEHRVKIQNSNILNALIEHIEGHRKMSATQVAAGLGLLRKVLPDLSAAENKTEVTHRFVARIPEKAQTAETWQQQHSPESRTIQ